MQDKWVAVYEQNIATDTKVLIALKLINTKKVVGCDDIWSKCHISSDNKLHFMKQKKNQQSTKITINWCGLIDSLFQYDSVNEQKQY